MRPDAGGVGRRLKNLKFQRVGQWREVLEAAQVQVLVDSHAGREERFGYLHDALEYLSAEG